MWYAHRMQQDRPTQDNADRCSFCGAVIPDIHDSPMLRDEVWESIGGHDGDFDGDDNWIPCYMCIDCMEKRLGRKVRFGDLMPDWNDGTVLWNERFVKGRMRLISML